MNFQRALKRMGPDIVQRGDGRGDDTLAFIFDAKRVVTGDFADFVSAHTILSRSGAECGKFIGRDGDDGASAAFAEESVFGGADFRDGDGGA